MSINHYSMELQETAPFWTHQQMEPPIHPSWPQPTWFNLNHQNADVQQHENDIIIDEEAATTTTTTVQQGTEDDDDDVEPMFEKPLTPSDVGKLNRLVIPKQHAEKYFPLSSSGGGGESAGECKGLLLSFEDESGKCWRFRYSYWNSSQSYVLTKGWSRYVKDKRLDAGDVVLFQRHRADAQRLFIGWRRRRTSGGATGVAHVSSRMGHGGGKSSTGGGDGNNENVGGVGWTTRGFYHAHPYPAHHHPLPYQHDSLHAGRGGSQMMRAVENRNSSSPTSSSSSRVLRLFGVNMECQADDDDSASASGDHTHHHFYHSNNPHSNPSNPHPHHMLPHQSYYY